MKHVKFDRIIPVSLVTALLVLCGAQMAVCATRQKSPYVLLDAYSKTESGSKLSRVRGLFWSAAQNRLIVTDTGNNRLLFLGYQDGRLKLLNEFKSEKMKTPLSAVETRQGKILVIEQGTIIAYEPKTGERRLAINGEFPDAGSFYPSRIALDDRDNLYVTDQGNGQIYIFDNNLVFKSQIAPSSARSKGFSAVKADKAGNIFAIDPVQGTVYVYGADGKSVREFARRGTARGELEFATDMAVDQQGATYLLDSHGHRIQLFDKNGGWKGSMGYKGWKEENLIYPTQVEVDSDYRLYVIDSDDSRLQVFIPAQGATR